MSSRLPTINANVIKPEPEEPGEAAETFQRGRSPPPGKHGLWLVKNKGEMLIFMPNIKVKL